MNFNQINDMAKTGREQYIKKCEIEKMNEQKEEDNFQHYLISYLNPYIEKLAKAVIESGGKKQEITININDIVYKYPITPYIKKRYGCHDAPIYEMIRECSGYRYNSVLTNIYKNNLSNFSFFFSTDSKSGFFRDKHTLHITAQYR